MGERILMSFISEKISLFLRQMFLSMIKWRYTGEATEELHWKTFFTSSQYVKAKNRFATIHHKIISERKLTEYQHRKRQIFCRFNKRTGVRPYSFTNITNSSEQKKKLKWKEGEYWSFVERNWGKLFCWIYFFTPLNSCWWRYSSFITCQKPACYVWTSDICS